LGQAGQSTDVVESSAILPNSNAVFMADHYFLPFELVSVEKTLWGVKFFKFLILKACQNKSTKIVVDALDSLQVFQRS
jgi:hypothetical protein